LETLESTVTIGNIRLTLVELISVTSASLAISVLAARVAPVGTYKILVAIFGFGLLFLAGISFAQRLEPVVSAKTLLPLNLIWVAALFPTFSLELLAVTSMLVVCSIVALRVNIHTMAMEDLAPVLVSSLAVGAFLSTPKVLLYLPHIGAATAFALGALGCFLAETAIMFRYGSDDLPKFAFAPLIALGAYRLLSGIGNLGVIILAGLSLYLAVLRLHRSKVTLPHLLVLVLGSLSVSAFLWAEIPAVLQTVGSDAEWFLVSNCAFMVLASAAYYFLHPSTVVTITVPLWFLGLYWILDGAMGDYRIAGVFRGSELVVALVALAGIIGAIQWRTSKLKLPSYADQGRLQFKHLAVLVIAAVAVGSFVTEPQQMGFSPIEDPQTWFFVSAGASLLIMLGLSAIFSSRAVAAVFGPFIILFGSRFFGMEIENGPAIFLGAAVLLSVLAWLVLLGTDFVSRTIDSFIGRYTDRMATVLSAGGEEEEEVEAAEEVPTGRAGRGLEMPVDLDERITRIKARLAIEEDIIREVVTNLLMGKDVILIGSPGTGKTELAKMVPSMIFDRPYRVETATSDWTTYDVIGGLMYDGKRMSIKLGCVTQTALSGEWLVIDEFNRADIDKAFGGMFTAIESHQLNIPTLDNRTKTVQIPDDYRIIGTLNTYDRHFLFNISYALMRRFAFIGMPIPPHDEERAILTGERGIAFEDVKQSLGRGRVERVLTSTPYRSLVDKLYDVMNPETGIRKLRGIGTAQLIDTLRFVLMGLMMDHDAQHLDLLDRALESNVLPQLDGMNREIDEDLVHNVETVLGKDSRVATELRAMTMGLDILDQLAT